jgi:hypothetical protein
MTLSSSTTPVSLTSRLGGWLPLDPHRLNQWLKETIHEA